MKLEYDTMTHRQKFCDKNHFLNFQTCNKRGKK